MNDNRHMIAMQQLMDVDVEFVLTSASSHRGNKSLRLCCLANGAGVHYRVRAHVAGKVASSDILYTLEEAIEAYNKIEI
jgi:hypothetical protein